MKGQGEGRQNQEPLGKNISELRHQAQSAPVVPSVLSRKHNLGITARNGHRAGPGLGGTSKAGELQIPPEWGGRGGTEGTGVAAGRAAQAGQDEAQQILPRSPRIHSWACSPSWVSLDSPRAWGWQRLSHSCAELQGCAAIPEAAPEPALPWALCPR